MTDTERKDASAATRAALEAVRDSLPADDGEDFRLADRGFIATIPDADIPGAWSLKPYAFLKGEAAPSVHPGLWRQAQLNSRHGLYEVTPGVYQVRGFDISTVTFIEGERGYIVIDPLTSAQPARTALDLMRAHRGDRPVTAVIYTHSHVDHYGGILAAPSCQRIPAAMWTPAWARASQAGRSLLFRPRSPSPGRASAWWWTGWRSSSRSRRTPRRRPR